jgi:hypothetical protein
VTGIFIALTSCFCKAMLKRRSDGKQEDVTTDLIQAEIMRLLFLKKTAYA